MLTVGSLFSGIGGLELGLERTGYFKTIWQVEIDDYATKILEKHWPNVRRYRDIRAVHGVGLADSIGFGGEKRGHDKADAKDGGCGKGDKGGSGEDDSGQSDAKAYETLEYADLICGGFPCQDISNAGKRKGITGERSGLWKEFLRVIREVRPRYVLIENVAALANRGLDVVLCDLAQSGYDAEWNIVSAASVGAPHRRERIFIVAYSVRDGHGGTDGQVAGGQEGRMPAEPSDHSEASGKGGCGVQQGRDAKSQELAHADDSGCVHGQAQILADQGGLDAQRDPGSRCQAMADTESKGRKRRELEEGDRTQCEERIFGRVDTKAAAEWWAAEPDVGRVADGVPSRVDRLKCLGNAVVPQVAEAVGRMIMELDKHRL
jgi:DNA (cytosine-5)-methyltransferase 1